MATWHELETEVPEFAARFRARLDEHKHKTIATLRGALRYTAVPTIVLPTGTATRRWPGRYAPRFAKAQIISATTS
jgi:hypothetical protein